MEKEMDRDRQIDDALQNVKLHHEAIREAWGKINDPELKTRVDVDVRQRLGQWLDEHEAAAKEKDEFTRESRETLAGARADTDIQQIMWTAVKENERMEGKPELGALGSYFPDDKDKPKTVDEAWERLQAQRGADIDLDRER